MLALFIAVTAISVYIYTTSGGDRSVKQEQSVAVTVNNTGHSTSDLLDLNNVTKDQLEALPGIGEALAEEIINARPFYSVEDLKRVPGIGPKSAKRILVELSDFSLHSEEKAGGIHQEATLALESLGFKKERIQKVLPACVAGDTAGLIKEALKKLS